MVYETVPANFCRGRHCFVLWIHRFDYAGDWSFDSTTLSGSATGLMVSHAAFEMFNYWKVLIVMPGCDGTLFARITYHNRIDSMNIASKITSGVWSGTKSEL